MVTTTSHLTRTACTVLAVAATAAAVALPAWAADRPPAQPAATLSATAPTGWLSGASGDGANDGTLAAWRGRPVDIVGTWDDQGDNQTQMWTIAPGGATATWNGPLDLAPGGLQPGDTWAQAAAGAYDDRWRAGLQKAAHLRAGKGHTYLRPFHEFNGDWYPWAVHPADAGNFVTAWKRYRAIQQQVFPDARLVYDVNTTSSGTDLDWRTTWPGADQADLLGVDTYNGWPTITTADAFTAQLSATGDGGLPVGLDAFAAQAKAWGVPLAVPEWSGRASMGDDPAFVTGMVDWFAAHAGTGPGQLAYEVLFNCPQDDGNFELFTASTRLPQSAQAYVAAMGTTTAQASTPSSSPTEDPTASPTSTATAPTSIGPTDTPQPTDGQ